VLEQHLAAQVQDQDRGVVDVELHADAADAAPVQMHDQARAAHRSGAVDVAGADQPTVGQLGDEAGDGRLVQTRLLRDAGAGPWAGVAQVAQHQAQVAAADGGLVRAPGSARGRPVVQPALLEHAVPTLLARSDAAH
jgi:hypothetical protein